MSHAPAMVLALLAASGINIGKVVQKQATDSLPQLTLDWGILKSYLTCRTWIIGFLSDITGAILMIVALSWAPVSVIEPVSGSGVAILAAFSHFYLDEKLQVKDWIGVGFATLGVIGVGVTSAPSPKAELLPQEALMLLMCFLGVIATLEMAFKSTRDQSTIEMLAGMQGGVFFGLSVCASRIGLLLQQTFGVALFAVGGIALSILLSSCGFFCQTRGMKGSRAVVVVTFTAISSISTGVLVGLVALNESVPEDSIVYVSWCVSIGSIMTGIMLLRRRSSIAVSDETANAHVKGSQQNTGEHVFGKGSDE